MSFSYRWPIAVAIGYLVFAAPAPAPARAEPALIAYGTDHPLPESQAVGVFYLAYPQSYGAMVDLLGYPDARDSRSDWYRLSGGRWLIIHYDGPTAVGHNWRDF